MAAGSDPEGRDPERALARRLPPPRARKAFRDALRQRFVGTSEAAENPRSQRGSGSRLGQGARKAPHPMLEELIRRHDPAPLPRPEFRADMRERFAGSAAEASARGPRGVVGSTRSPRGTGGTEAPRGADRPARPGSLATGPFSWQVAVGLLATAAAVVLLVVGSPGDGAADPDDSPAWTVRRADGTLRVDGAAVGTEDPDRLARLVSGAHSLATVEDGLELDWRGDLRLAMEPASHLDLPPLPGSEPGAEASGPPSDPTTGPGEGDRAAEVDFRLEKGAVHMMTVPDRGGSGFVIETPHALVRISGTVISIEVIEGEGTCFCVAEGTAEVEVLRGTRQRVVVGEDSTCFVFADDREPVSGPSSGMVSEGHLEPLRRFQARQF